ncbi:MULTISPECIES: hypothetical protein [Nocardiopsis]|uniref:Uncharacterized protein n=1 Tax=Nocardiopsis changdeensis TaxID=2831969 RepID=A0ABX8BW79_9ACTN|nr:MULTISPECIES: hypothetical protein [Nocardiopsis]QUX26371.1 hypothetical protein KGD84_32235 [Nocardiopsis changdeensis]QYX40809.1 hypothetical protein K1J57_32940 [Nocardiopsis sp. MT53]
MPATTIDHEDYIKAAWRAIPDAQDCWTWTDPTAAWEALEEEIEVSDAAIACSYYLDTVDPGRAGIVTLPDGHALGWHETGGWTVIGHAGLVTVPGALPADASPAQVTRLAAAV